MSQHIIAISWSHHQTPLDFRDKLALSLKELQHCTYLFSDKKSIIELTALSTCNRIEFYALADTSADVLTAIKHIYDNILKRNITWDESFPEIYTGINAVCHLYRVAAGMESMVLGESQILSQVKVAYNILMQSQPNADVLNKLFNAAIFCAKTVRNDAPVCTGPTSISEIAVLTSKKIFNNIDKRRVILIGAGETAALTASYFRASGVKEMLITNRSEKRAKYLAESISVDYINMRHLNDTLPTCDVIVTITNAKDYLIKRMQVESIITARSDRLLLLDLSTPRNIDPSICDLDNVWLYDLDQLGTISLQNKQNNKVALEKAEIIIQHHSREFMHLLNLRDLQDTKLEFVEERD